MKHYNPFGEAAPGCEQKYKTHKEFDITTDLSVVDCPICLDIAAEEILKDFRNEVKYLLNSATETIEKLTYARYGLNERKENEVIRSSILRLLKDQLAGVVSILRPV